MAGSIKCPYFSSLYNMHLSIKLNNKYMTFSMLVLVLSSEPITSPEDTSKLKDLNKKYSISFELVFKISNCYKT